MEATPPKPYTGGRHSRFHTFPLLCKFIDLCLGGSRGSPSRQAYHPCRVPPTSAFERSATPTRLELHIFLQGGQNSRFGVRNRSRPPHPSIEHRFGMAARAYSPSFACNRMGKR